MSLLQPALKMLFAIVLLLGQQTISFSAAEKPLKFAMLIPGKIDDGGFMEAGDNGLIAIQGNSWMPRLDTLPMSNQRLAV